MNTNITINGKKFKIIKDLGFYDRVGLHSMIVGTKEGQRIAVKHENVWKFWNTVKGIPRNKCQFCKCEDSEFNDLTRVTYHTYVCYDCWEAISAIAQRSVSAAFNKAVKKIAISDMEESGIKPSIGPIKKNSFYIKKRK